MALAVYAIPAHFDLQDPTDDFPMTAERQVEFLQLFHADAQAIRAELAAGLLADTAVVSPKYLYDALGARLFEAITELPQYYPTRTEAAIFAGHGAAIAQAVGQGHTLIDLGAGNCRKAAALFAALQPRRYVALDISVAFLHQSMTLLQREYPQLPMLGVGIDFFNGLDLPDAVGPGSRLYFYPGSSIGNFAPDQALALLQQLHTSSQGGGLLIGVDLVKPLAVLEPAYDDPLGVTAAFNRNLLLHVNQLLGSDFDLAHWQHEAGFNAAASRIEMHLRCNAAVRVRWSDGERNFVRGERIHTENSCKYDPDGFDALLRRAGFTRVQRWSDPQDWFALYWAQP